MKRLFIPLLHLYKRLVSPLLPPACRFHPTCSAYAREALEVHGIMKGGFLSAQRVLSCHPWSGRSARDPVPQGFTWSSVIGYKRKSPQ